MSYDTSARINFTIHKTKHQRVFEALRIWKHKEHAVISDKICEAIEEKFELEQQQEQSSNKSLVNKNNNNNNIDSSRPYTRPLSNNTVWDILTRRDLSKIELRMEDLVELRHILSSNLDSVIKEINRRPIEELRHVNEMRNLQREKEQQEIRMHTEEHLPEIQRIRNSGLGDVDEILERTAGFCKLCAEDKERIRITRQETKEEGEGEVQGNQENPQEDHFDRPLSSS
jgi:hypothetical protein